MKRLLIAAALALPLLATQADAQAVRMVPKGFCSLSSLGSATGLASCPSNPLNSAGGIPPLATYAVICAYTQNVNYRDDGAAPTATTGTGGQTISAGFCIGYSSTLSALQFIQQTASAVLGVTFYQVPGQ